MHPASHTPVSSADARSIIHRHDLGVRDFSFAPWMGGGCCVYPLGDEFVLKVPHDDPGPIHSISNEAIAVLAARSAGVRTPRLVAFDDSLDHLPVPFLIYEQIHGETLAELNLPPYSIRSVWREVGHDLALLHSSIYHSEPSQRLPTFDQSPEIDPWALLAASQASGRVTAAQAHALGDVLDRLTPYALSPVSASSCLCHGDVNVGNIIVSANQPRAFMALLDWGGAGWGNPATDASGISLRAVPFVLEGYREIAPMQEEKSAESRILWSHLQLALFSMNRDQEANPERVERLLRDTRWFERRAQIR